MSDEIKRESKERRGGYRKNSGRKPWTIKGIVKRVPKETAALILSEINAQSKWISLLNSKDEKIVLEALKYLTDKRDGKAAQSVKMDATVKSFDNWTDQQLVEFVAGSASIPSVGEA